MKFISKIHGEIEYEQKNIITFNKGLLGLSDLKEFILLDLEDYEPFKLLQSLQDNEIAMIVTSPYEFFKDYEFVLSEETIKNLKIDSPGQVNVVTTVTLNSDVKKITTNLQGPIVINTSNNIGEQIILDNPKYKVKSPLI
ncbi:flagellar assembly protein FliW [Clostridium beijerinckii]|uniref:Flagellar assembly factor FliW n=1 Tax=Clostridium beijerinckii TaxID=1520 RepID=A0A9Q5CT51_CLOBE|nr:flagellar assembly protein FliW [Clostridium beijerinckii]AQS07150.1 flagellar assembly factor FliW [Clostridium beijerinckii]MBA2883646.1 flagellar assembly factor FliW [Clostridium beijerinckii]MBA2898833.1 flagellar assembly factor FliW [Clostridium beijerinckii]MBA2908233.1 flagellar assembly factor FliW [Clostridium beijerinckii]MBA9013218.1 flagellar assembly factor FliW [Clostridium beijerinckii]